MNDKDDSCFYLSNDTWHGDWHVNRPPPAGPLEFGKGFLFTHFLICFIIPNVAFSSIMFAFAGASTFPTIQADMKNKDQFPKAVVIAMAILCFIYS